MDNMPVSSVLLQSLPEGLIIIALGLVLIGQKLWPGKIIMIAALSALAMFLIRRLPLIFGLHTIIGVFVLTILLILIYKVRPKMAFAGALLAIAGLITTQLLVSSVVLYITGLTVQQVLSSTVLRVIVPIPEELVLALITLLCIKYKFSFVQQVDEDEMNYGLGEKSNDQVIR